MRFETRHIRLKGIFSWRNLINLLENLSNKGVLATATQGLNEKEQKIITLRHGDGLSFKEISETLKESINTVKSRYRRALANMKESIKRNNKKET